MNVSAVTAAPAANEAESVGKTASAAVSQNQFLQLLVAQLRHQDPMSPTDSEKFLSQLAQFSQLQETIEIRKGIDQLLTGINLKPQQP